MKELHEPAPSSRGPEHKKKDLMAYLHNLDNAISTTIQTQKENAEKPEFFEKLQELETLARNYIEYLKAHEAELGEKEFENITRLAKSSLLLNLKVFMDTANQDLAEFRSTHPDFDAINSTNAEHNPWQNIKNFLYGPTYNTERENYREGIAANTRELSQKGNFDSGNLEHLERFLPNKENIPLHDFLIKYIKDHKESISAWAPMDLGQFQKYVLTYVDASYDRDTLSQNPDLMRLEEELASIKIEHLQSALSKNLLFTDRPKKIKFLRDLRFGRIKAEKLRNEIAQHENEITNDPNLARSLGPLLRKNAADFMNLLISTKKLNTTERRKTLNEAVEKYGNTITPEAKQELLQIIQERIKD